MTTGDNKTSERMFARAQRYIVGGVDSPVRSFNGVGMKYPLFISRARGSKIFDEDGNRYIDYVCSWGASILGSAHPSVVRAVKAAASRGLSYGAATDRETDLAERIKKSVPSMELLRFVSSGTEATMSTVRVARAFTKRSKVIKFNGCYHGHADGFLVSGGSGLATFSVPDSAGVPEQVASQTLVAKFNDIGSVQKLLMEENRGEVAAVIVEPVAGNMGVIPPEKGFLAGLRKACDESGSLLIFDEVITGFRVARGGAQELYGVRPDLTCLGKVIGGGMNIAAYGGRADVMKLVSPLGPVYQAGTLSGNPVAVASGSATLDALRPSIYAKLERSSANLERGLVKCAQESQLEIIVQRVASMIGLFFVKDGRSQLRDYAEIKSQCSKEAYSKFFASMLHRGVYLPPSAFETIFVSAAHTLADISQTIDAARKAFGEVLAASKR